LLKSSLQVDNRLSRCGCILGDDRLAAEIVLAKRGKASYGDDTDGYRPR
jgi:hypothetical protein